MESPTKKKKLTHNNFIITEKVQQLNGDHDLVRVILDDTLLESAMLKKKLGGNKIRMLHTKSTRSEFSPTSAPARGSSLRHIRTSQKLLFLGYYNCVHIYDIETLTFIRKVSLDKFMNNNNVFEVDSMGEYLYLTPAKSITKIKLDSSQILWTVNIGVDCAIFVESKDEIYFVNDDGLHILDINDGTVKKTISHELESYTCSGIIHDEEEGMIYCSYKLTEDIEQQDDEPFYKLVIFNEESDTVTEIDHDKGISFISLMENYYICYSQWTAKLFKKNSNTFLMEYELYSKGSSARKLYFDSSSSTLWNCCHGGEVAFNTLDIEESIIDTPLNKEICNALQKLGGKLPCFIPKLQIDNEFVIPECLEYLSSIDFKQFLFWFIDGEVASIISFDIREWIEENETFTYELSDIDDNKFCFFVKKSEVSTFSNGDFTIYLRYINESECNFIKSWKLSEFITKVSKADSVKLEDNEYSIHFEKIYEQLLDQQIINPQTKEIDRSILFDQYQKTIWGHFGSLTILELVKHFQDATIQFDHVDYKKIDLILLSKYCQPFCFVKL